MSHRSLCRVAVVASFVFSSAALAQPQGAKDLVNAGKKPALTQAQYKALVVGLEPCKVIGYQIDGSCQGAKDLAAGMKGTATSVKDMAGMSAALGRELISHPAPAVRVKAASLMGSIVGSSESSEDVITAAAEKEADPGVMQALIRTVASSGATNKKVAAMLIKAGSHADAAVRTQAVFALGSSWNREMAGGAEKLLEMAAKDSDPKVRAYACEYGGQLANKLFLPFIEKATDAKATDKDMYNACLKGLVKMFHEYPLYDTSNEAAYKLFLKRIGEKPRTNDRPFWNVMDAFDHTNDEKNEKLTKWKAEAKWFKAADVKKVLVDVIADKNSNWMARTAAVKSMLGLGATKAELEALKKGYDEKVSNEKMVLKAIDEAIAKAP